MKIYLDEHGYAVSPETLNNLEALVFEKAEELQTKLPMPAKLAAEQIALAMIYQAEKDAVGRGVPVDIARNIRPQRGESPISKLLYLFMSLLKSGASDAEFFVKTRNGEITSLAYGKRNEGQSQVGG